MTEETKIVVKTRVRKECENCGEPAVYRNTYLSDGATGARRNPASSAYGKDDCTWCCDHDEFLCHTCQSGNRGNPAPKGYGTNSTFSFGARFDHMFFEWREREISPEEIRVVFDGPPSHESGRFVEVETPDGKSISIGEWHTRADNLWELRIPGVIR